MKLLSRIFVLLFFLFTYFSFCYAYNIIDTLRIIFNSQDSVYNNCFIKQSVQSFALKDTITSKINVYRKFNKFRIETSTVSINGVDCRTIIFDGSRMWQLSKGIKKEIVGNDANYLKLINRKYFWQYIDTPFVVVDTIIDKELFVNLVSKNKNPILPIYKMTISKDLKRVVNFRFFIGKDVFNVIQNDWHNISHFSLPFKSNIYKNNSLFAITSIDNLSLNVDISDSQFDVSNEMNIDVKQIIKNMFTK